MKKFYTLLTVLLFSMAAFAQTYSVTLQVDMSEETVSPNGVHVAGNFQAQIGNPNDWDPAVTALTDMGGGLWSTTVMLADGTYEFKFINGNMWGEDESIGAGSCLVGGGNTNREITVSGAATSNALSCFNSCDACGTMNPEYPVTLSVDMTNMQTRYGAPANGVVSVAGAFQGWTPGTSVMTETVSGSNIYEITLMVPDGTYQYKFLYGDAWGFDETAPMACGANGNRELVVDAAALDVPTVCFSTCDASCPALLAPVNVTFRVDMSNEIPNATGLFVAGTFQFPAWVKDILPLVDQGGSIYEYTTQLVPDSYQYKFFNGNGGDPDGETTDFTTEGCGEDNPLGGSNRLLDITGATGDVLVEYVYNTCTGMTTVSTTYLDQAMAFNVNPNPFNDRTIIQFSNENNANYSLEIYNLLGKQIKNINNIQGNTVELNREAMSPGVYFATLRSEEGRYYTQKIVIQ